MAFHSLRAALRDRLLDYFRVAVSHDEIRDILHDATAGFGSTPARLIDENSATPYEALGVATRSPRTCDRDDLIFLTGRFRSGSTLLWNLFRHLDGVTAYYEPFNERRWFDPARRGDRVDRTHRGVGDYWREYDGLDPARVPFRDDWASRNLYLAADAWNPAMRRYVETLVEHARGRPVLKFNRIDFRLPWFRRAFPRARFVHIVRHPRDQWCSTLLDAPFGPDGGGLDAFAAQDGFYLLAWVRDLGHAFPFLRDDRSLHPYRYFYWLWKLSYLFGRRYADVLVRFEDLVDRPRATLAETFDFLRIEGADWDRLCAIVEPPRAGRWRDYASAEWFAAHEAACEEVLGDFIGDASEPGAASGLRGAPTASSVATRWRMPRR